MLAAVCAGCASSGVRPPDEPVTISPGTISSISTLELLDAAILPPVAITGGIDRSRTFGSVSGLVYDERSTRYLAVIDDRQPARMAWIDITFGDRLHVAPIEVVPVVPGPGVDARRVTGADLEAVVALPDGTFVATEEGHRSTGAPGQPPAGDWPVALLSLSNDLTVTRVDDWPEAFGLDAAGGGVRDNQGAESLALTPDGRLVAGLEQPLLADKPGIVRNGRPFGGGLGGPGRLIEFVGTPGTGWRPRRQWLYPIGPTEPPEGFGICDDGENGLTDLLALTNSRFLSLERACLQSTAASRVVRNTARVYEVDVSGADDVSAVASLSAAGPRPVSKRLVLDLDAIVPRLPPELARLENFEALAFGPTLPDGSRTLLVVSDDNFRATQWSAFLIFRIG